MVKRKHVKHTRQFKEQAVALAKGSDRTLAEVAQGLGVAPGTLAYWVAHPPADAAAARVAARDARAAAASAKLPRDGGDGGADDAPRAAAAAARGTRSPRGR
jgi:transposase-like protein